MDTAARQAQRDGGSNDALVDHLCYTADSLGVRAQNRDDVAVELLLRNPASSVLQSLLKARVTATQIAPVEMMRALSDVILDIEAISPDALRTPQQIIDAATVVITKVADVGQVVEDQWFGRESLSDEEVYRRFAQQQQQQQ